ncbi:MAG: alpha/beta hydrolase family protein [Promethearchaeota archaeon]
MKPERNYYAFLETEEDNGSELDDLEMALLLKEHVSHKPAFKTKGESDLNKIASLYSTRVEWEARAKILRRGILKGLELDPLPRKTPLNPVIHSRREIPAKNGRGYTVENVFLEIIPGFFASGNLYKPFPLDENKPHPVYLTPHGHGTEGRFKSDYQALPATLARMGGYAMSYDMQGYNEATQVKHKAFHVGTLQTWQSMRILDFMLSLKGADPERVCCTGNSGGGTQTFLLTALDDRVKLSIPVVMVSSEFYGGCSCESGLPIHKNVVDGKVYATNNAEVAAMASYNPGGPRPLLLISIGNDWTALTPRRELIFIQDIYGLYGGDSRNLVENTHLRDEQHNYGPNKRQAAYKFISKHFNINVQDFLTVEGRIDESDVQIQDKNSNKCFTKEHPRPKHALQDEGEVLGSLKELQQ